MNSLLSLLELSPPPFIYINDPIAPKFTLQSLLFALRSSETKSRLVHIDGISCYSPRLLYDSILNGLARHTPVWEDGCHSWSEGIANNSFDSFLHALTALHKTLNSETRFLLVIEKPEKLKERMPDLLAPLTRLTEMSKLDLSILMVSEARWEELRPTWGAAIDPYYVDIPVPTKEVITQHLLTVFNNLASNSGPRPYHPVLFSAFQHFVSSLVPACIVYTNDPHEIQYIAAARWPGFIKPYLDANVDADDELEPPPTEILLRLTTHFKPSLSLALEQLYPRLTNAADWARANESTLAALARDGIILGNEMVEEEAEEEEQEEEMDVQMDTMSSPSRRTSKRIQDKKASQNLSSSDMKEILTLSISLPRLSQFILVAAYIASMNPVKSDLRIFGRSADEKKRKRRQKRQTKTAKPKSGPAKIPQRFLGPSPFPLSRLIAILGALVEENDPTAAELNQLRSAPPDGLDFRIPGEKTDYEINRVGVYASITQLTSLRMLVRMTSPDKLDGMSAMFKCGPGAPSSYESMLNLAKGLGIKLPDLMWDNVV